MTIPAKYQYIAAGVLMIVAFASGRYSINQPKIQTIVTQNTQTQIQQQEATHTEETITETKQPNGADTTVTKIDQVKDDTTQVKQSQELQVQQTVTPEKKNTLNVSVLGGNDFSKGLLVPTYGLSVTKSVLGPITIGAFGLMNGVVGVSIGLNF